jgi:hypothetical protein
LTTAHPDQPTPERRHDLEREAITLSAVLIDDLRRLDGVTVIGVDELVWRHTRRGDQYVTVIINLTPVRAGGGGPAVPMNDFAPGRLDAHGLASCSTS